ncbi:MAG: D-alanine--D-alanine ligase, partial [uncultured Rubrobacteraceae bacterium]
GEDSGLTGRALHGAGSLARHREARRPRPRTARPRGPRAGRRGVDDGAAHGAPPGRGLHLPPRQGRRGRHGAGAPGNPRYPLHGERPALLRPLHGQGLRQARPARPRHPDPAVQDLSEKGDARDGGRRRPRRRGGVPRLPARRQARARGLGARAHARGGPGGAPRCRLRGLRLRREDHPGALGERHRGHHPHRRGPRGGTEGPEPGRDTAARRRLQLRGEVHPGRHGLRDPGRGRAGRSPDPGSDGPRDLRRDGLLERRARGHDPGGRHPLGTGRQDHPRLHRDLDPPPRRRGGGDAVRRPGGDHPGGRAADRGPGEAL